MIITSFFPEYEQKFGRRSNISQLSKKPLLSFQAGKHNVERSFPEKQMKESCSQGLGEEKVFVLLKKNLPIQKSIFKFFFTRKNESFK